MEEDADIIREWVADLFVILHALYSIFQMISHREEDCTVNVLEHFFRFVQYFICNLKVNGLDGSCELFCISTIGSCL